MHIESFDDKFIIYINKKIDLEDISGILLNYKNLGVDIKSYNDMVIYDIWYVYRINEIVRMFTTENKAKKFLKKIIKETGLHHEIRKETKIVC